MAVDQVCGQQAFGKQFALAIHVGHHRVQQACTLGNAGLQHRPVGLVNDEGQQVERPRARGALCMVGVHIVGNAVVTNLLGQRIQFAVQVIAQPGAGQAIHKISPGRAKNTLDCQLAVVRAGALKDALLPGHLDVCKGGVRVRAQSGHCLKFGALL